MNDMERLHEAAMQDFMSGKNFNPKDWEPYVTKLFDAKPFIIAEVGSNWRSFNDCKHAVQMAKQCGADAVKFQAFTYKSLYGLTPPCRVMDYRYDELDEALPLDWLPKLADKAKAAGIEFMCTAFSPDLVKAVDPYVSVHKIASSDNTTPDMLHAVAKTGKPVILSCGAATKEDILGAIKLLKEFGAKEIVLLYCNAAYPSRRHNLFLIEELKKLYGLPVGLSDHSSDVIYAPLSAHRHFGAVVIEKHFSALPDGVQTPDSAHSLNVDEFKCMVDYIRGKRDGGGLNPTSEERAMFLRHNRRLLAVKDLQPGDVLEYAVTHGPFRSLEDDTHGLCPLYWKDIEGKVLTRAVAKGKGLSISDVK